MIEVYLGLGSSLGRPETQLKKGIYQLGCLPKTRLMAVSPFYKSPALRTFRPQPDVVNCVIVLKTALSPFRLLKKIRAVEKKHKRVRNVFWGGRTLDIDILTYGGEEICHLDLMVPHPELKNRAFWLKPMHDLAPDLIVDGGVPLSVLIQRYHNEIEKFEKLPT